jgi:hypothetical protein
MLHPIRLPRSATSELYSAGQNHFLQEGEHPRTLYWKSSPLPICDEILSCRKSFRSAVSVLISSCVEQKSRLFCRNTLSWSLVMDKHRGTRHSYLMPCSARAAMCSLFLTAHAKVAASMTGTPYELNVELPLTGQAASLGTEYVIMLEARKPGRHRYGPTRERNRCTSGPSARPSFVPTSKPTAHGIRSCFS